MTPRSTERLSRRFYARPSTVVAPDLLGRVLVRTGRGGSRVAARIVETEAYEQTDPASHSFRGPTARNGVMFGPAGHLYVYFTYGMHFCMNVVTDREGWGSAVLLRAAEPLEGVPAMRRRRRTSDVRLLCSGPGRLTQAFGIDRRFDGTDVVEGPTIWIERGAPVRGDIVQIGPRVGIRSGVEQPWRFSIAGDPFVSRGRPLAAPRPRR
ncbi:MAG: DNA-3-methyladenine glycosylase [Actinomycetota bacterium]|jgi:DNA-3-methyladenine glycosylase